MKQLSKIFFTLIIFSTFFFPFSIFADLIINPEFIPPQISDVSIEPNKLKPGQSLTIKAKVIDDSPIILAKANLSNLGAVFLNDEGNFPDEIADDGFYTAQWTIPEGTNLGEYTVEIIAMDIWENEATDNSRKFEVVSEILSPEKYAPNLWFDSQENYYPTSPFFDGDSDISGADNKRDYESLTPDKKQKDKFKVFYHIVETENEFVYEYWFYYVYNNMPLWNEHFHDWEAVFVFVDKNTKEINRVVGSAHWDVIPNNELIDPEISNNVWILTERGSHANCPDRNGDGKPDVTNIGAYGIKFWNKEGGYKIKANDFDEPHYILQEITPDFINKFAGFEKFQDPTLGVCINIPWFFGTRPCILIGGEPPTHPWHQSVYHNPYEIIPKHRNFIRGRIFPFGAGNPTLAIILLMSDEPYHYTLVDKKGDFTISGDIKLGPHDLIVNLEGYAPYKQRFIVNDGDVEDEENEIIVGVDGILNLIPENEAFKLKGTVKDSNGNIIVNSQVNVYDKDGNQLFTTLTDENGHYLFNLSSEDTYTVEVIKENKIEKSENIKSEPDKELVVNLSIKNPKLFKKQSIDKLEQLKNNNPFIDQKINQIIKSIQSGFNGNLWIDDTHLKEDKFQGSKVFFFELMAVSKMKNYSRIIKKFRNLKTKSKSKYKIPENLFEVFDEVSNSLAKSDYLLAETILQETKEEIEKLTPCDNEIKKNCYFQRYTKSRIKKAEQYLKQAEKQRLKKNYSKSIIYSYYSWTTTISVKQFLRYFDKFNLPIRVKIKR